MSGLPLNDIAMRPSMTGNAAAGSIESMGTRSHGVCPTFRSSRRAAAGALSRANLISVSSISPVIVAALGA
jgi:hypothetical protein